LSTISSLKLGNSIVKKKVELSRKTFLENLTIINIYYFVVVFVVVVVVVCYFHLVSGPLFEMLNLLI